jgi:probable HAF family extracellular repeat protein
MRPITILAAGALGGLFAASSILEAHAFGYTFTDINVPGSQSDSTGDNGLGINNLGQIAGSYNDSAGNSHGFLYTGGKYVTIDAPGASDTYVYGINDLGQILGVSDYLSTGKIDVFLDTHGTFTNIADANTFFPLNSSLNDRDQVFGEGGFGYGVLNVHGVITPINLSGAYSSASPSGFNNLDQVVGTVSGSAGCCQAFIDTKGVFTQFGYPGASYTGGYAINDWGQVVGPYYDSEGNGYGFLYTNGHFTTFQDPNAAMLGTEPLAINDLGQIVGWYYDAQENIHSFIATPNLLPFALTEAAPLAETVPEASTWVMLLLGFAGLAYVGYAGQRATQRSPFGMSA